MAGFTMFCLVFREMFEIFADGLCRKQINGLLCVQGSRAFTFYIILLSPWPNNQIPPKTTSQILHETVPDVCLEVLTSPAAAVLGLGRHAEVHVSWRVKPPLDRMGHPLSSHKNHQKPTSSKEYFQHLPTDAC